MSAQQASGVAQSSHPVLWSGKAKMRCASHTSIHDGCHAPLNFGLIYWCIAIQTEMDLFNYLLRQRIIFLGGYVNDKVGSEV